MPGPKTSARRMISGARPCHARAGDLNAPPSGIDVAQSDDALQAALVCAEGANAASELFGIATDRERDEIKRRTDECKRLIDARAAIENARVALAKLDESSRIGRAQSHYHARLRSNLRRAANINCSDAATKVRPLDGGNGFLKPEGEAQRIDVSHNTTASQEADLAFAPIRGLITEAHKLRAATAMSADALNWAHGIAGARDSLEGRGRTVSAHKLLAEAERVG